VRSLERVLVLYEHGRAGEAAIDLARDLAEDDGAALTVVAIAPRAPSGPRCGNSALEYNEAVADSVAHDLEHARERLGAAVASAAFVLLVDGVDQTLEQLAGSGGFDLVLLPGRRRPLRASSHPEAARLQRVAGAEIRIVDGRAGSASEPRQRSPRPAAGAG
jgi:nucleotide-binding universal stress UspA family protein